MPQIATPSTLRQPYLYSCKLSGTKDFNVVSRVLVNVSWEVLLEHMTYAYACDITGLDPNGLLPLIYYNASACKWERVGSPR